MIDADCRYPGTYRYLYACPVSGMHMHTRGYNVSIHCSRNYRYAYHHYYPGIIIIIIIIINNNYY